MTSKRKAAYTFRVILSYVLIIMLVLFTVVPLLWIISTSLKPSTEVFAIPPHWIPRTPTLDNYSEVLFNSHIPRYFLNSFLVGIISTLFALVLGVLAGYGFARYRFRGNQPLSLFMLFSQMLPLTVLMIPIYFLLERFHMLDTLLGLALAHLIFTLPLVTWMNRSYFLSIPKDLEESAQIDGCSHLQALWKVVLPLAAPGIAATGIYAFIGSWNEFVLASILTSSEDARTLPIGLTEFSTQFSVDWGSTMAASTLISLPAILLFLWLQKYFVQGLAQGGVKG